MAHAGRRDRVSPGWPGARWPRFGKSALCEVKVIRGLPVQTGMRPSGDMDLAAAMRCVGTGTAHLAPGPLDTIPRRRTGPIADTRFTALPRRNPQRPWTGCSSRLTTRCSPPGRLASGVYIPRNGWTKPFAGGAEAEPAFGQTTRLCEDWRLDGTAGRAGGARRAASAPRPVRGWTWAARFADITAFARSSTSPAPLAGCEARM